MSTTPRDLRRRIEDLQDTMTAEYGRDAPYCEIAHQEFGIEQTPLPEDESDAIRDQFRAAGVVIPEDSIKLTVEHREFHDAMRRAVLGLDVGVDAIQLLSAGMAIGRRIGMAEAASSIKGFEVD